MLTPMSILSCGLSLSVSHGAFTPMSSLSIRSPGATFLTHAFSLNKKRRHRQTTTFERRWKAVSPLSGSPFSRPRRSALGTIAAAGIFGKKKKAKSWIETCLEEEHGTLCGDDLTTPKIAVRGIKVIDCETLEIKPTTADMAWIALSYVWRPAVPNIAASSIIIASRRIPPPGNRWMGI